MVHASSGHIGNNKQNDGFRQDNVLLTLLEKLRVNAAITAAVFVLTFILGAGFYIRASQLFPRTLTTYDIASSPAIWGRIKPLLLVLIFFLRAPAVWVFVTGATLLTVFADNRISSKRYASSSC